MPEPLTRKALLAGGWYPGTAGEIEASLDSWGEYVRSFKPPAGRVLAAVAPHAGWIFSGRLAAAAVSLAVRSLDRPGPELVIVLGGHLAVGAPVVAYEERRWETPLGPVELAPELNEDLDKPDLAPKVWAGPTDDNTIEVHMPLVKALAPEAKVWALRVPPSPRALTLGAVLARRLESGRALAVASTDLTHYGPAYGFAPAGTGQAGEEFRFRNDRSFIEPALALDPLGMILAGVNNLSACSAGAAAAAAEATRLLGGQARLLDHYSSADVMPGEQSVGYAGLLLETAAERMTAPDA